MDYPTRHGEQAVNEKRISDRGSNVDKWVAMANFGEISPLLIIAACYRSPSMHADLVIDNLLKIIFVSGRPNGLSLFGHTVSSAAKGVPEYSAVGAIPAKG
jgi:hypothetical protein